MWKHSQFRDFGAGLLLLLLAVLASTAAASPQAHKDNRLGFELGPPRAWTQYPVTRIDPAMVARYLSEEGESWADARGQTRVFTPELRVLAFYRPTNESARSDPSISAAYETHVHLRVEPGYDIVSREDGTSGDSPTRTYEIRVSGASRQPERVIRTRVFGFEAAEVAFEFEIMDSSQREWTPIIERTFGKIRPRKSSIPIDDEDRAPQGLEGAEMRARSPEARALDRRKEDDREWRRIEGGLPKGWSPREFYGVRVIDHGKERDSREIAQRIRSVLGWLDANFSSVGSKEYVHTPIVWICKDGEELNRLGPLAQPAELGLYQGSMVNRYVAEQLSHLWFRDKNPDFWLTLPRWVQGGVTLVSRLSEVQRDELEFDYHLAVKSLPGDERKATSITARELMQLDNDQYSARAKDRGLGLCSMALVGLMLDEKRFQPTFAAYVENHVSVVAELCPSTEDESAIEPGEVSGMVSKRRLEQLEKCMHEVQSETFRRSFLEWTDEDWEALDDAYTALLGKG